MSDGRGEVRSEGRDGESVSWWMSADQKWRERGAGGGGGD